jgi:phosphoglycerate dehydrogenase-like enzyme
VNERRPVRPVAIVLGAREDEPPEGIEAAREFADLRFVPDGEALVRTLAGADALFFWRAEPGWLEAAWPRADRLRWIQSASDGVDGLLFPALMARDDVVVTNARGVFDEPIAEWVVGAMLAFATGLHRSIVDQPSRRWQSGRHTQRLAGRRLVAVGPGPIGRAVARRALALGMSVAAVGRRARDDDLFGAIVGPEGFHATLARADDVVDSLPLTPETRRRFDAAAFTAMRPGARFYHVGRGPTVDEDAMIQALRRGHLGAAALDVFEVEPLPETSPLWTMPNVIVSPHVSGDVEGWERQVVDLFVDNLRRFVAGEVLCNPVDKVAGFGAEGAVGA